VSTQRRSSSLRLVVALVTAMAVMVLASLIGSFAVLAELDHRSQAWKQSAGIQRELKQLRISQQQAWRLSVDPVASGQVFDRSAHAALWAEVRLLQERLAADSVGGSPPDAFASLSDLFARLEAAQLAIHGPHVSPDQVAAAVSRAQALRIQVGQAIVSLGDHETERGQVRDAEFQESLRVQGWSLAGTTFLILSLGFVAMLAGLGEVRRRRAAQAALVSANAELERRVRERTETLRRVMLRDRAHAACVDWLMQTQDDPDESAVVAGLCARLMAHGAIDGVEIELVASRAGAGVLRRKAGELTARAGTAVIRVTLSHGMGHCRYVGTLAADPREHERVVESLHALADVIGSGLHLRRERGARAAAEAERAIAAARLSALVVATPMALALIDGRGRVRVANARMAELAGVALEDLRGMDVTRSGTPLLAAAYREAVSTSCPSDERLVAVAGRRYQLSTARLYRGDERHDGVAISLTDVSRLADAQEQAARFSRQLLEVEEDQRRALARELHDDLGQRMAAIRLNLGLLRLRGTAADQGSVLDDSLDMVQACIAQVRARAVSLRPELLDELGLGSALHSHVRAQAQRADLSVDLQIDSELAQVCGDWAVHVFRIVQEALRNTIEHARARSMRIALRQRGGEVRLMLHDDGCGLNGGHSASGTGRAGVGLSGTGLCSIRERVELTGGRWTLEPGGDGRGVGITAVWPGSVVEVAAIEMAA
jgi:signal transduction histidine kinase